MKVEFSESSWHYRLQSFVLNEPRKLGSLCPYFWKTVFCLAVFPLAYFGSYFRTVLDPEKDNRGYWETRESNFALGFKVSFGSFVVLYFAFLIILLLGLLASAMFSPIGAAIGFGLALFVSILVGAYKTSDLWVPYAESVKDSVCPIIYWQDEKAAEE